MNPSKVTAEDVKSCYTYSKDLSEHDINEVVRLSHSDLGTNDLDVSEIITYYTDSAMYRTIYCPFCGYGHDERDDAPMKSSGSFKLIAKKSDGSGRYKCNGCGRGITSARIPYAEILNDDSEYIMEKIFEVNTFSMCSVCNKLLDEHTGIFMTH